MKTAFDIRNPIFHDEDKAREHLETLLWPHGPSCPRCGVLGDRITKLQGKSTRPGVYKCKDCPSLSALRSAPLWNAATFP